VTYAIFRPEDAPVLEYRDDGATVEPLFYVPIVPMVLINGIWDWDRLLHLHTLFPLRGGRQHATRCHGTDPGGRADAVSCFTGNITADE
jgi:hypothetical protein